MANRTGRKVAVQCAWLSLLFCLAVGSAQAQQITGDIRGVVKDPSGAVVSGATVKITNADQGVTIRTIKTGADGAYIAPLLPIGHYQITVEAPGFERYVASDIVLNLNDRRVDDVTLKLGSTTQEVTVTAAAQQVNLQNNTSSGLITGTEIRQLSTLSRNFIQLVTLMPGVSANMASDQIYAGASNPTGLSNQINIVVNGGRPSQESWLIDGAEDLNRGSNLTLYAYPSLDSIAEFKVERANFLPEHGRASAGEISVVTRGGTNAFHGSGYEFFRNDKLNANNFFQNMTKPPAGQTQALRPPMRWNDWGFEVGGPVGKPAGHNNTFFFYSQEWRHFITYTLFPSSQLPTPAEMSGALPATVCTAYDANNYCSATGTSISTIDPMAQGYIKDIYSHLPAGTFNPATGSLSSDGRNLYYYREEAVRIDHNFGEKVRVFGRYSDDSIPTQEPGGLYNGLPLPGLATTQSNTPAHMFSAHVTDTLSPTLLNDGGYNYAWGGITSTPIGYMATANAPDVKPTLPFPTTSGVVPSLSFQNGQSLYGFGPYRDYDKDQTVFDSLSWTKGEHSLKFGVTFDWYSHDENSNNYPGFTISDSANCGPASPANCPAKTSFVQNWANFLLGRAFQFSEAQSPVRYLVSEKEFEAYAQDEWRLTRKLSIDYGVRLTRLNAPLSTNDLISTFDPHLYQASQAPAIDPATGFYVSAVDARTLTGYIQSGKTSPWGHALSPNQTALAPRVGFAWDPFGKGTTSIRGGYGLYYGQNSIDNQITYQTVNPGVSPANTSFSNTTLDAPTGPAGGGATTTIVPPHIYGPNPLDWKIPYTHTFDLDVQHQLNRSTTLDVGYYGNRGRHLMGIIDENMPKPLAFQSIPGYCAKYNDPECYFHAFDYRRLNYVRPYSGYDAINEWNSAFHSSYDGLQAQISKSFSGNSLVVANYTWSHDLTNASENFRGAEDTYNLNRDYGNAVFDRRHVFTAYYVYTLPFYKSEEGFAGHVLGGWELSGLFNLDTGIHYDFSTNSCQEDYVGFGTCGYTWAGDPPDQLSNPNKNAPHTITQWFNPAAFAFTGCSAANPKCTAKDQGGLPPLRQGDAARGTVEGPGIFRWDASLFKNTRISERVTAQFRAEFFNATNHTNLASGAPVTGLSTALRSSLYDHVLNARDARQIQLALKLVF